MYWPMVVVFSVGAAVAYFAGVRKGAVWGNAALIICVLGLIGAIGFRTFGGGLGAATGQRSRPLSVPTVASDVAHVKALAEAAEPQLAEGSKIVLPLQHYRLDKKRPEREQAVAQAVRDVLGAKAGEVVVVYPVTDRGGIFTPTTEGADAVLFIVNYNPEGYDLFETNPLMVAFFPKKSEESARASMEGLALDIAVLDDGTVLR